MAVSNPAPILNSEEETATKQSTESDPKLIYELESMDLTESKVKENIHLELEDFFYSYRKSISPRIGMSYGDHGEEDVDWIGALGMSYRIVYLSSTARELGFNLFSSSLGQGFYDFVWIFRSHKRIRPFYRVGLSILAHGDEGLATFLNYQNFQIQSGGGIEYSWYDPMSFRLESDVSWGFNSLIATLFLGYTWAW